MVLAELPTLRHRVCNQAPLHKIVLLLAWLVLHGLAIWALALINSDLRRAYAAEGWQATRAGAALGLLNTILYMRLYSFPHHQANAVLKVKAIAQAGLSVFSSSLLQRTPETYSISQQRTAVTYGDEPVACFDGIMRYCKPCGGWQAAVRSHHCRECGVCIPGFDHHCYWLGTCVGDGNHLLFWWYLLSQTSLCLLGLHYGLTAVKHELQRHMAHAWGLHQWTAVLYTAMLLAFSLVTAALLAFHTYLILSNRKTYELIKGQLLGQSQGRPTGSQSPFDRGPTRNLYNFLFNRQLYNSLHDGCKEPGQQAINSVNLWDNIWYSCC